MTQPASSVMIESFGMTDKGKVRPNNEDNYIILAVRKSIEIRDSSLPPVEGSVPQGSAEAHLFVVADGVGGGPDGDPASADTVAAILAYVKEAAGCFHKISAQREHELFGQLEDTVQTVHQKLLSEQRDAPGSASGSSSSTSRRQARRCGGQGT
jgi:serine/threonine protein phosphatase PrpC